MANQYYDNFVLQSEINNQFTTLLDLSQFCTPELQLTVAPGNILKVNVYDTTGEAEEVAMGEGNKGVIETTLVTKDYEVKMVQSKFAWHTEEENADPTVPVVGSQKVAASIVNKMRADIIAEFEKATLTVAPSGDYFADFIDAVAKLDLDSTRAEDGNESLDAGEMCFALVNKVDLAKIRKSMKDNLKYVEAFTEKGYVGTVAGVNIYVTDLAKEGEIIIGHRSAIKLITKSEVEIETDRDADTRTNYLYGRQAYVAALYDATKVCLIKAA